MSITVGDILKVVAISSWLDGNLNENVFSAAITGTGGPYDDTDIVADALAWANVMFTTMVDRISQDMPGSEVRVYVYDAVDDDYDEVGSAAWGFTPTDESPALPRGVAALLNAKTTDPDVQGKKYLGGQTENDQDDSLWGVGHLAALVDFGAEWVVPFVGGTSGADWDPGVWSTKDSIFWPMSLTVIIPTMPAYQRRRKRGIGV